MPTAWWTAIAHAHLTPWTPGSSLAVRVNRAIDDRPGIQQEAICYQWFKQRLMLSVSEPSISQRSQIKEDTVEPTVLAREFNLKVYTAITWHNDWASRTSNPDSPITVTRQRVPWCYRQRQRGRLIQSAVIDIFPKVKMTAAGIWLGSHGTTHKGICMVRTPCKSFIMIG